MVTQESCSLEPWPLVNIRQDFLLKSSASVAGNLCAACSNPDDEFLSGITLIEWEENSVLYIAPPLLPDLKSWSPMSIQGRDCLIKVTKPGKLPFVAIWIPDEPIPLYVLVLIYSDVPSPARLIYLQSLNAVQSTDRKPHPTQAAYDVSAPLLIPY